MKHIVEVGDMKIGRNGDQIVTYALGSCLGLMVYDPAAKVGGLLHAMLPLSSINPEKASENPFMFVDSGTLALFKAIFDIGGRKKRLLVKAAGCGNPLGKNKMFKIGERNYTVLEKLLMKNSVLLKSMDIGGTESRTIEFDLSAGRIIVNSKGREWEL